MYLKLLYFHARSLNEVFRIVLDFMLANTISLFIERVHSSTLRKLLVYLIPINDAQFLARQIDFMFYLAIYL